MVGISKRDALGFWRQRKKTLQIVHYLIQKENEKYIQMKAIHQHYNKNNNSIWDFNDKQDVRMEKAKHKAAATALSLQSKVLICKCWIWKKWAT